MFFLFLNCVLFLLNFQESESSRKLLSGRDIVNGFEKPYVVYLVKSQSSQKKYDAWLCGGAIVSTEYVVTSAACVVDVDDLYVLAGYSIYVKEPDIYEDPCFKVNKKKVIYKCYAREYDLQFDQLHKWSYIDIAVVKVESPFNFAAAKPEVCSYVPKAIPVNYQLRSQMPGRDAIVYGWGHKKKWRKPGDKNNYNVKDLNYAPVILIKKSDCVKKYTTKNNYMEHVINKYMICSEGEGVLNLDGKLLHPDEEIEYADGCETIECMRMGNMLRNRGNNNITKHQRELKIPTRENVTASHSLRRQGICQNDHGGPLVSWRGVEEVLIGVASAFRVDQNRNCVGPFLYTSTQCNGKFLYCILNNATVGLRTAAKCDSAPALRGFDKVEKYISWVNHPDGPADNEIRTEKKNKEIIL